MQDGSGEPDRRKWALLTILVVLAVYTLSTVPAAAVQLGGGDLPFHSKLADSMLHGHLDIRPVPPGLLQLEDPYDPVANEPFRVGESVHDLALYEGRLYSIHGLTQAVLLNIPVRLLGTPDLPDFLATLLFVSGGFLAAVWILVQVRSRYMPTLAIWAECSLIAAVGLATPAWWILTVGRGYESSIACGYFLLMLGLALLLHAGRRTTSPDRWALAGGAACLAAAVGVRPHLVLAGVYVVVLAVAIVLARRREGATRGLNVDLLTLVGPYLVIGALLGAYNLARFGALTDFGTQYQLSYWNMREYPITKASYLWPNLHDYLVSLPRLELRFPFVFLQESTNTRTPEFVLHTHEPIAGSFVLYSVIPVGLSAWALGARSMWRRARPLVLMMGLTLMFSLVVLAALSLPFNSSTMRYAVDYAPVLVLVGSIGWGWSVNHYAERAGIRQAFTVVWLVALAMSVGVGSLLTLTYCGGTGSC